MAKNEALVTELIGKAKYDEEMEVLKNVAEQDSKRGQFVAVDGDIDDRDESAKNRVLGSGYATMCGVRGGKLSGGQKQRVAIARTIIREPKILILDEATSALDEDSQKKVQKALENAMKGRTTIIIAHRMSTIDHTDYTYVLENGKVTEEGKTSDLKTKEGSYLAKKHQ